MSNIIDTTIRYLEEKWPGRFIINFFGYLVVLVPIALGYVIIKKGMKLISNDNDKLWVQFKNFMTNQIPEIHITGLSDKSVIIGCSKVRILDFAF